jgi:hypothetical protein
VKRGLIPLLCGFFMVFVMAQSVFSQKTTVKATAVKCSECHKNLSSVLPASHKNYKITNTSVCFTCHKPKGEGKPLGEKIHVVHLAKKPDVMDKCFSCHTVNKEGQVAFSSYPDMKGDKSKMEATKAFFNSWISSPYLDHSHRKKGVYCLGCHSNYLDEIEADETQEHCVKCHGNYEKLIELTANTPYEKNPHKSHYVDLKCSLCHHGHKEFADYCVQCHNFGYKAPTGR